MDLMILGVITLLLLVGVIHASSLLGHDESMSTAQMAIYMATEVYDMSRRLGVYFFI